ncbi:MAG: branched-chain amino acid ABC transporter permease, partial [Nitrospinota bacterium]
MFRPWTKIHWTFLALGLLFFLLMPAFEPNDEIRKWFDVLLIAIMAMSWNFIGGLTGYPSFAPAAFFGIGAYFTAIFMNAGVPFFATLFIGAFAGAFLAFALGVPILRLKGHYFAIASYGVAEALRELTENLEVTGGGDGINLPLIGGGPDYFTRFFYYAMLGVAILSFVTMYLVTRNRLGWGLVAIRENEDAAAMLGVETTKYKISAFVLSAVYPAMAGGVYAYRAAFLEPIDVFDVLFSIRAIVMSLIGGVGTIMGPILGAGFIELLNDYLWGTFLEFHSAFLGIIMVLIVIFIPKGFFSVYQ